MSELYKLPTGWEWKKLGDLAKFQSGGTPKRSNKEYWKGNIPWVKISDIGDNLYLRETEEFITKLGLENSSAKLFSKGTILYTIFATIGKIAILDIDATTNQAISGIEPNKTVDKLYMYYVLKFITQEILKVSAGVAQNNINLTKLKNQKIPLPSLVEQKRIVAKLDSLFEKIDKAIELHQQNITNANTLMASTLDKTFKKLEGEYHFEPLFAVADVSRGKSKHRPRNDKKLFGGQYPFIQTGDVRNANKYIVEYTETYNDFGLVQSRLWKKGTICMTIAANIGDVAILGMDSCFPDSIVGIFSEKNCNEFIYYFLLTLKQSLESQATTTAQMNINLKVLESVKIPLPPLPIQQQTVEYLDSIATKVDKIKQLNEQKLENLKALKASILDKAFRGEL
ncbi:restriction endonuclease subunit S [Francisella philomiragia]|uniref:Restriction endonuclease subunit S n=1 Tax=Francisella philomiragia TaxID=28110 RepID=A0ABS1GAK1_9GAMM|nr:restriction endonuclease subunit S [Francisella philomiragia]MBK2258359.1 restriction endonuclease subunit S [Francisella philomiragia]MBK2301843.1 restriction endonuclease subunit S [Francisella philomiragia]